MSAAVVTICFSLLYRSLGLVGCSSHTGRNACQLVHSNRIGVPVGKFVQRGKLRQVAALDRFRRLVKLNGIHVVLRTPRPLWKRDGGRVLRRGDEGTAEGVTRCRISGT